MLHAWRHGSQWCHASSKQAWGGGVCLHVEGQVQAGDASWLLWCEGTEVLVMALQRLCWPMCFVGGGLVVLVVVAKQ
jgi:hypothetical protein